MTRIVLASVLGLGMLAAMSGCESKSQEDRDKMQRREPPTEKRAAPGSELGSPAGSEGEGTGAGAGAGG